MKCHSGGAAASPMSATSNLAARPLVAQLLRVVFAERALSGGERGAHVVGGHLLADRQEAHGAGRAAGGPLGGGDPLPNLAEPVRDRLGAGHRAHQSPERR